MGCKAEQQPPLPWVVMVPYPALGHVTPMLNLARLLHPHGSFRPAIALPAFVHRLMFPALSLNASGHAEEDGMLFVSIPDGVGDDNYTQIPGFFEIVDVMENRMPAPLDALLRRLDEEGGGVACVVVDLVASWAIEVARRCGIPVAGFWPAMLATFRLISTFPEMIHGGLISDDGIPLVDNPIQDIVRLSPVLTTKSLPWLIGNQASKASRFKFWRQSMARSQNLQYIIVNSFAAEDAPDSGKLDEHPAPATTQFLPLAPLLMAARVNERGKTSNLSFWEEDMDCLTWLSTQKPSSVIYISFGSLFSTVGPEKVAEVAAGLEASGKPFLWVLRDSWREGLPVGFAELIAGNGKVVRWAPQREVLKHEAVGCFLTHCGWNSTMEAIECGKCLLCYPLGADQDLNCAYVVSVWKVGMELRALERRCVEESVRRIVEGGEELRERMRKLRDEVLGEKSRRNARIDLELYIDALKNKGNVHGEASSII